jgi:hypothetical protein
MIRPTLRGKLTAGFLTVVALAAFTPSLFADDQPHMKAALEALQRAKQELQAAEHDKEGHREKALQLTNQAINQTRMGIHAGNQNDHDHDKH